MSDVKTYPDFDALCKAVGFTVITWAHIEIVLDASIGIVFQSCGGDQINPELPRTLKGKLSFMRKSLRRLATLKPFQEQGLALMDRISNMKQQRHDVVHGVAASLATSDGTFEFRRLDAKGTMHHIRSSSFDLKKFPEFSQALVGLGADMNDFCRALAEEYAGVPRQSPQ